MFPFDDVIMDTDNPGTIHDVTNVMTDVAKTSIDRKYALMFPAVTK